MKQANLFMLFLLAFNLLFTRTLRQLYWGAFHGTQIGYLIRSPWWLVINQVIGLLLPLAFFTVISGPAPFREKRKLGIVNGITVIALSLLIQPTMMLVSGLASLFLPNPVTGLISELVFLPLPVALIIVALTPAICEELVFRGFIQSRYEGKPLAVTAIVNGLFFGAIHMNLHQFTYAFFMGILFVLMVHITKSLFSAILAHFVVNAVQYTIGYLSYQYFGPATPAQADLMYAIADLARVSLFTLPIVAFMFYGFVRYNTLRSI